MNFLFHLIVGSYRIRFFSKNGERILNYILEKNIPVWGIMREEESISFSVFPFYLSRFQPFFDQLTSEERVEKKVRGSLRILFLFRKRWGFFAGFLFLVLSLYVSTLFLWGVEVTGNGEIPAQKIREELAEFGLRPGALLSKIDAKEIALRYQVEQSELLFVNVNIIGTKAFVEVREREAIEKVENTEGEPSNMVASIYGTIVRYEVLSGQIEVKKGDPVTEGTLLISGVKETKSGSFYTVRAQGRVFAETERSFQVTIPFHQTEEVYTGREWAKKRYEILGITLSLPLANPLKGERYETLESVENLSVFGYTLPIMVRETLFLETREKKAVIEVDRAEELAYDKYEQFKRDTFAQGDEILSEEVSISQDENGVTLTAELSAVEDICREVPFQCVTFPS